MEARMQEI